MKRFTLLLVLALAAAAVMAASALAGASVTYQTFTSSFSDTGLTDGCLPGATGAIAGTAVVNLETIQTTTDVHVVGTEVDSGRIDWSNGDYTIIGSTDRFSFNGQAQGTFVNTDAHQDFGNVYSADGVLLFRETFKAAEHFTVTNGSVTRVEFVLGHPQIFGSDCTP